MGARRQLSNGAMNLLLALSLAEALTGRCLGGLTAAAAAVVLVTNLPFMGKTFRLPAWIFAALGAAVLLLGRAPAARWAEGLNSMLKTVVVLIAMQLLSLAMRRGGYGEAVAACLASGIRRAGGFACLVMLLAHLLASVMSLGAVPFLLTAVEPALAGRAEEKNRLLTGAISRGYSTLFLWAPGTVTVLMSMQIFSLSWQDYFPPAFLLAVLGLALGAALSLVRLRSERLDTSGRVSASGASWRKLGTLGAVLAAVVLGITVLERLDFSTATGRLVLVTLFVASVWLLLQRGAGSPDGAVRAWWSEYLPQNGDLSAFFLSMGLFSAAVEYSGAAEALTRLCRESQDIWGPLALPLLPLAIVAFSLVGLHPFVSVLMVGPILTGMDLAATPLQLGLAMSLGCCLSYMLSPFAGLTLVLSSGLKQSPGRICLGANLGYAVMYYLLAVEAIALLAGSFKIH